MTEDGKAKATTAAKPAAKKPPAKKRTSTTKKVAAARGVNQRGKAKQTAARAKAKAETAGKAPISGKGAPRGARLTAAQQAVRDSLMIQRLAQDWPWEAIAEEAGISLTSAKRAVAARQKNAPLRLNMDPVAVIEKMAEGYQLSIGDLEAIASQAMQSNNLTAAIGAKKGANEARDKILALFQATGRLPQELSQLRHLIDVRQMAVLMMDSMDVFERDVKMAGTLGPAEQRRVLNDAADQVRGVFAKLLGLDEATLPEAPEEVADAEVVPD